MGDARTATTRTLATSDTPQTVPGWCELLDRLEAKEERIEELEQQVARLQARLKRRPVRADEASEADGDRAGSTAKELVDALRRTAESSD